MSKTTRPNGFVWNDFLVVFFLTPPMKVEQCSETSSHEIQMPGNHPKERIQHSKHGESLKSRMIYLYNSSKHVFMQRSYAFIGQHVAQCLFWYAVYCCQLQPCSHPNTLRSICSDRMFTSVSRSLVAHELRRRRPMFWCSAPSDSPLLTRDHGA